jgi:hypothetical protein
VEQGGGQRLAVAVESGRGERQMGRDIWNVWRFFCMFWGEEPIDSRGATQRHLIDRLGGGSCLVGNWAGLGWTWTVWLLACDL